MIQSAITSKILLLPFLPFYNIDLFALFMKIADDKFPNLIILTYNKMTQFHYAPIKMFIDMINFKGF